MQGKHVTEVVLGKRILSSPFSESEVAQGKKLPAGPAPLQMV